MSQANQPWGDTVQVEITDRIAWVTLNRPDKKNCMNPALNREMGATLQALETREDCGVLVLTGAGESWSAGMDLQEYFREIDDASHWAKAQSRRESVGWQWGRLSNFMKPTIAMVNGWCFGGAFTPLVGCDLAIASENARFGLSEINWGILPGGLVTKVVADVMRYRDGLYYIMTGETFDGRQAAEMGLVNEAVPADQLKNRTEQLAKVLLEKDPVVLRYAKDLYKRVLHLDPDTANDYIYAKLDAALHHSGGDVRRGAMGAFLDDKQLRPGLETYKRK